MYGYLCKKARKDRNDGNAWQDKVMKLKPKHSYN